MLSKKSGNLFVVGDEDQSIYSWRGAEIRNILDFPKDFPGAKIYKLEQNYRSTTSILKAANNVIKNNSNRNEKNLWSEIKDDNSIEYYEAYNDRDEATQVARTINTLHRNGEKYSDMAVLVRANSVTRQFEEEFNLHGIPYKVFGGFRFYERKEIKDALAYVRLAINPSDNDSILRVVNYPKRGIGNTAVQELQEVAKAHDATLFSVLVNPEWLTPNTAKNLLLSRKSQRIWCNFQNKCRRLSLCNTSLGAADSKARCRKAKSRTTQTDWKISKNSFPPCNNSNKTTTEQAYPTLCNPSRSCQTPTK